MKNGYKSRAPSAHTPLPPDLAWSALAHRRRPAAPPAPPDHLLPTGALQVLFRAEQPSPHPSSSIPVIAHPFLTGSSSGWREPWSSLSFLYRISIRSLYSQPAPADSCVLWQPPVSLVPIVCEHWLARFGTIAQPLEVSHSTIVKSASPMKHLMTRKTKNKKLLNKGVSRLGVGVH